MQVLLIISIMHSGQIGENSGENLRQTPHLPDPGLRDEITPSPRILCILDFAIT